MSLAQTDLGHTVFEIESLLRTVATTVRKRGRAILVDFEITPPQFDALLWITRHKEEITIGELSAKLGLAYSTTTDLVDRLEKQEFVVRVRDRDDRRVVRLHMLPSGDRIIVRVLEARREYLAGVLEHLHEGERNLLLEALRLLEKNLGSS